MLVAQWLPPTGGFSPTPPATEGEVFTASAIMPTLVDPRPASITATYSDPSGTETQVVSYRVSDVVIPGTAWRGGQGANVCHPAGGDGTDKCGDETAVGGWQDPDTGAWFYCQCVELAQRLYSDMRPAW